MCRVAVADGAPAVGGGGRLGGAFGRQELVHRVEDEDAARGPVGSDQRVSFFKEPEGEGVSAPNHPPHPTHPMRGGVGEGSVFVWTEFSGAEKIFPGVTNAAQPPSPQGAINISKKF